MHAIGDRATGLALDGFAAAGCTGRIEHAQQVRDEDLPRFAELGVVASVQPRHALDDRDAADQHWAGRPGGRSRTGRWPTPAQSWCSGPMPRSRRWTPGTRIASADHRSLDGRAPWHPEQHLDLDVALAAASGSRRAVRVGDTADLVVVAEPPAAVLARNGADGLRATEVLGTLVAGRWTHRSAALA